MNKTPVRTICKLYDIYMTYKHYGKSIAQFAKDFSIKLNIIRNAVRRFELIAETSPENYNRYKKIAVDYNNYIQTNKYISREEYYIKFSPGMSIWLFKDYVTHLHYLKVVENYKPILLSKCSITPTAFPVIKEPRKTKRLKTLKFMEVIDNQAIEQPATQDKPIENFEEPILTPITTEEVIPENNILEITITKGLTVKISSQLPMEAIIKITNFLRTF